MQVLKFTSLVEEYNHYLELNSEEQKLIESAMGAAKNAYAPYSRFSVGSALLLNDGTIAGGMIPKAESCMEAVGLGVPAVHILDGRIAHVSIIELFTDAGIGTMVTKSNSTKVAK
jgi:acetylglutamate kinase